MMTVNPHPDLAWLIDYAAGNLTPGFHTVIAGHLEVCAVCREQARAASNFGLKMINDSAPQTPPGLAPAAIRSLNRASHVNPASPLPRTRSSNLREFVASRLSFDWAALNWRAGVAGLRIAKLQENDLERVWLLHGSAGTPLPKHSHSGAELALILHGAYRTANQEFGAGDIDESDEAITHQPIVTAADECFCLLVFDGQIKYTGAIGLAQRILKF